MKWAFSVFTDWIFIIESKTKDNNEEFERLLHTNVLIHQNFVNVFLKFFFTIFLYLFLYYRSVFSILFLETKNLMTSTLLLIQRADICRCLPPDKTWHKVKSPKAD